MTTRVPVFLSRPLATLTGVAAIMLSGGSALAQPQPPRTDLSAMNDEFDGKALDGRWSRFDERFGYPSMLKMLDVGATTPGALHLQPYDSAWVRDKIATFLFQTVEGDFDMRARVRVRGANGPIPGGTWSLGGLMARSPNGQTSETWKPHRENWHFLTTGVGQARGKQVTETKGTYNSYSSLKLRPFETGWVELRMVRVGMTIFALARTEGGRWQVRDRFYRMSTNPAMQVGLIAYTGSDDVPPGPEDAAVSNRRVDTAAKVDMLMDVDWIRFTRPRPDVSWNWEAQVTEHPLADLNLSEAAILAALGD
ncbi:MAG: hypothetical protein AB1942_19125 [Pseudomonadota bacterium]